MTRPRAADDFAAIRARMEKLRRESNPAPPSREVPRGAGRLPGILDGGEGVRRDRNAGASRSAGTGRGAYQSGKRGRTGSRADRPTLNRCAPFPFARGRGCRR